MKYAELLREKIVKHNTKVWLVNTGWSGGIYGRGNRYPINFTRKIVDDINNNLLENTEYEKLDVFNLEIPLNINGLDSNMLNPKNNWTNKLNYDKYRNKLSKMFIDNFKKYQDHELFSELIKVGPDE